MKTLVILPLLAPLASAATLAVYEFDSGPTTAPVTTSGVSATTISTGAGLGVARSSGATFAPSGANALGYDPQKSAPTEPATRTPTNVTDAVNQAYYFTFTLTPASGTALSLSSFSLWGNYSNTAAAANNIELQIDTGAGFAPAGSITLDTTGAADPGNFHSISLSGHDAITAPVTFRVVMYDTDDISWTSYTRLDDIRIEGSVIPEPSLAVMLLTGLPLCAVRRRSR